MTHRFVLRILLLLLSCNFSLFSAENLPSRSFAKVGASTSDAAASVDKTARPIQLTPGAYDGQIAWVTSQLLEQQHYARQKFDRALSSKFLDHYLEALDPQHLHFLQSDLADFEPYRTNLQQMTIARRDVSPGCVMFNRFMQRLQQRVAYIDDLLASENFIFDTDERVVLNRHELPYPKDLDDAKALWRQRLRSEYLQEKLTRIDLKKKNANRKIDLKDTDKKTEKPKTEAEEIVDTLKHSYHRSLRNFTDWNSDDVLQVYLDTLAHLYDPHSDYMGMAHLDSFQISMNLSLSGIGAELTTSPDGYCTINRLLPGGPASKSKKIKEKDRIVAVAQGDKTPVDVVDMNLNKVVQMIRGPKGTEVRLTILPAGASASASTVIALVRDEIKLEDQAAKAKLIEVPDARGDMTRLGIIDLPSFYAQFDFSGKHENNSTGDDAAGGRSTSADVARLLKKLKAENVRGIVLDLRRNGGGSLEEAVKLTGLFIKEGPVVQVRNFQGQVEAEDDNDPSVVYDGPLIVLTSRFSASASEILAGALQDYGRALIVGDASTHGKGTVQSVNPLRPYMNPANMLTNDPGAVKLTIKKFYRASGASTQLKGVVPDIVLPSVLNDAKEFGEASLDNPLPWDVIPSARFHRLNLVDPYLPELRKLSDQRVISEKDFAYVREDIAQFKKQQADKTVSLNEKVRLKEKDEIEARQKARDKERLARKEPDEKIYELTLRLAEQPGLPAPVQKTNNAMVKLSNFKGTGAAGVSSNSAAVSPSASPLDPGADDTDEEKAPGVDINLKEAEHILIDYSSLLKKGSLVTAGHAAN